MSKNEASSYPLPNLPVGAHALVMHWGHLAISEAKAVGPHIDSVNDYMEKGK